MDFIEGACADGAEDLIHVVVKFGSEKINIACEPSATIGSIKTKLTEKTGVTIEAMKLIMKGKIMLDSLRVKDFGNATSAMKFTLVGSKPEDVIVPPVDISDVRDDLSGHSASGKRIKLKTTPARRNINTPYKFGRTEALEGFSDQYKAQQILQDLANDPAILKVLAKHKWSVGALCEMFPEGYVGVSEVCVMGLNQNHGEKILLRLRTDDLKGFRKILSIRSVLFHELAHNVYSDHDDNFYMLMRQIEREVNDADWSTNGKGRKLDYEYERYQGSSPASYAPEMAQVYRLGGNEGLSKALRPAELAGLAAASRLTPEEQEVERGCARQKVHSSLVNALNYGGENIDDIDNIDFVDCDLPSDPLASESVQSDLGVIAEDKIMECKKISLCSKTETKTLMFMDVRSRFLAAGNDIINKAVSLDQGHIMGQLELLRDAILTFIGKYYKDDPHYILPGAEYSEIAESMHLILLIATNAKVYSYS